MSVNVYFKNEIEKDPLFKRVPEAGYLNGKPFFNGENLFSDSGILYLMHKENLPIPEALAKYVSYVTFYEHIPADRACREQGVYKLRSATANVEIMHQGKGRDTYFVKIKAEKLEDAQELLHSIKIGTIRPTESYEGYQQGLSKAELERKLSLVEQELASARSDHANKLTELRQELAQARDQLGKANFRLRTATIDEERVKAARRMAAELDLEGGFTFKRTIATRINRALNDAPDAATAKPAS